MKEDVIDIEAKVIPLEGSIANPFARSLATRKGRGSGEIFAPPADPEMRGRRATGIAFRPDQVPEGCGGVPIEEPGEIVVYKRNAKQVAEQLTNLPVGCHEENGMCYIDVFYPLNPMRFHGRTWFLALLSLKRHVDPAARR